MLGWSVLSLADSTPGLTTLKARRASKGQQQSGFLIASLIAEYDKDCGNHRALDGCCRLAFQCSGLYRKLIEKAMAGSLDRPTDDLYAILGGSCQT